MSPYPRIQADTINNLLCIQFFHLCIGIQFIKIGYAKSEIGISKQFHRFRFGKAHEQSINTLFKRSFLEQSCKCLSSCVQPFRTICGNDNSRRIQIVIQRFGFPQELRAENNIICMIFLSNGNCVSYWNG